MKMVVLDGYLVGFDGLRPQLRDGHEMIWYDYSSPREIVERAQGAQAVITNRTQVGEDVFAACPDLCYVGTLGTGYNIVDIAAADRRGITVCNAPGYSEAAVAQGTFALLLEIAGGTSIYNRYVREGNWVDPLDRGLVSVPMIELLGKTMGIVGMGSIGTAVAKIATAFGMRVIACGSDGRHGEKNGVPLMSLGEVLAQSDVISLHCPLNERTKGMIDSDAINCMKDGAVLLNTARGALLNEGAVAAALDSGKLSWLGADVLATEPPKADNPLARHPRAVITPHVAWIPRETRRRLMDIMTENFHLFAKGTPRHVVNHPGGQ